jgi:hypothetical protein
MGAHAAALAVIQVGYKQPFLLVNASLRTIDLAEAAFNAFLVINHWYEGPPGSSLGDLGAARINQPACLYLHQETLS